MYSIGPKSLFDQLARSASIVNRQLSVPALVQASVARNESVLTDRGALRATTGKYTGRSPRDKFLVDTASVHDRIDWGKVNQPMSTETFDALARRIEAFAAGRELYVFDGFAGADPTHRLPVRVVSEFAWHSLFVHQLLIRPTTPVVPGGNLASSPHDDAGDYFLIVDIPSFKADPAIDGTNSEVAIALDLERRMGLIVGTEYAGEIKKSVFTVLNYLLPQQGVFPMHCSANSGQNGGVALFFGLSGTGKTTLSADPERMLIGDDEHGWSDNGVFNFEGGCYAKCIRLRPESEPEIWNAIKFGSVLENVAIDPATGAADYDDTSLTENTRCAYPIDYIPHAMIPGTGGHPTTILFLTADAFGVLPPISRLTREQAMYHFLSGYTSKLAGTERGVTTPEPNFSACFGAPFWPLPPTEYARMLGERLDAHDACCYLVNTGWIAGAYAVGRRIDLADTRTMVHAAMRGEIDDAATVTDPVFGLHIPTRVAGLASELLLPWQSWSNRHDYEAAAYALAERFATNFERFPNVSDAIASGGPSHRQVPRSKAA